jgi:hypothetical protein
MEDGLARPALPRLAARVLAAKLQIEDETIRGCRMARPMLGDPRQILGPDVGASIAGSTTHLGFVSAVPQNGWVRKSRAAFGVFMAKPQGSWRRARTAARSVQVAASGKS